MNNQVDNCCADTRPLDERSQVMYIACMASKRATTIRLDPEDVRALSRARRDGISSSELIRRGLRVAGAKYYDRRRRPTTGLFTSVDTKLGDESELFRDLEK
jgi:hypothetical protein